MTEREKRKRFGKGEARGCTYVKIELEYVNKEMMLLSDPKSMQSGLSLLSALQCSSLLHGVSLSGKMGLRSSVEIGVSHAAQHSLCNLSSPGSSVSSEARFPLRGSL